MPCRTCVTVVDWVEREVVRPVERLVERQEQRCRDADCNWWVLCLNKLICWIVTTIIKVIEKVVETVLVQVVRVVCRTICEVANFVINLAKGLFNVIAGIVTLNFERIGAGLLSIGKAVLGFLSGILRIFLNIQGTIFSIIITIPVTVIGRIFGRDWLNGDPPSINTPEEAKAHLTDNPGTYKKLNDLAKYSGWFTTPFFKESGVMGWTNYNLRACATGRVLHTASSTDGFYTVDLEIDKSAGGKFEVSGTNGISGKRYIRVEILPEVIGDDKHLPQEGETVQICGGLFWDADGFLEIHPMSPDDYNTVGNT